MGSCQSSSVDSISSVLLKEIGLSYSELNLLFDVFSGLSPPHCDSVDIHNIFTQLGLQAGKLEHRIFSPRRFCQVTGAKSVNFSQFVCLVWCFLSLEACELAPYIFIVYDDDNINSLTSINMRKLLVDIHGDNLKDDANIHAISELLLSNDNIITASMFAQWCQGHPSLCSPLKALQATLRRRICGEAFWSTICNRRSKTKAQMEASYVRVLSSRYKDVIFRQELSSRLAAIKKELTDMKTTNYSARGVFKTLSSSVCSLIDRNPSISTERIHAPSPRQYDNPLVDVLREYEMDNYPPLRIKCKPLCTSYTPSRGSSSVSPTSYTAASTPTIVSMHSAEDRLF